MYFGGRKEAEESDYKPVMPAPKEGTAAPKPSDVRNGDLVSLLLAATPPYLYNMPLVPQTFFFSEMLRSFVHAKAERQTAKSHHVHRRRKRSWREATPPKTEAEKPLELTTPRAPEKSSSPSVKRPTPSCDFTAEKLANSSVPPEVQDETPLLTPPMWYPNIYNQPQYPIDPLHFFIDLRVSAHIWDRKLGGDRSGSAVEEVPPTSPLNLASCRGDDSTKVDLHKYRHNSAFSVPNLTSSGQDKNCFGRSNHSVHYLMNNLKDIYRKQEKEEHGDDGDVRAVEMKLLSDDVKQESDASDADGEEIQNKDASNGV